MLRKILVPALVLVGALLPPGVALGGPLDAVEGAAPHADFTWAPADPIRHETITFTSRSWDEDDVIVLQHWRFGDAPDLPPTLGATATHAFSTLGAQWVNLTVVDARGNSASVNKTVFVRNAAPMAAFDVAPEQPTRAADVTFSDASTDPEDDALVAWWWDFGDGTTATGRNASHRYASLGSFTVTLTVQDAHGTRASASSLVRVANAAPVVNSATVDPVRPAPGQLARFNASATDPDGAGPLTYEWRFSDGATASGAQVEHAFATTGNYSASVTAYDEEGAASSAYVLTFRVDFPPPTASFDVTPTVPTAGSPADFADTSSSSAGNPIVAWNWDFGDATTATTQHPTHTYEHGGTYLVRLRVTDQTGGTSETTRELRVNALPAARFEAPSATSVGAPTSFTDRSTDLEGPLVAWSWSFGDGATSEDQNPTHTFHEKGNHLVTLTVTDSDGATASVQRWVVVQEG